jgi:NAD(P)-dependent dehydrogenase (short-subunit alcohol dehydrogenase family)
MPIDFQDLKLEHRYSGQRAYGKNKMAMALFTLELAQRYKGTGVMVNAFHPGSLLDTKMVQETFGRAMRPVQEGADAEFCHPAGPGVGYGSVLQWDCGKHYPAPSL